MNGFKLNFIFLNSWYNNIISFETLTYIILLSLFRLQDLFSQIIIACIYVIYMYIQTFLNITSFCIHVGCVILHKYITILFYVTFSDILTIISLFPFLSFYLDFFTVPINPPLFSHLSPKITLTPLLLFQLSLLVLLFTFLDYESAAGYILSSEDMELSIRDEREHALFLFLCLG